jgi:HPt (histidine-containing phosphotransfer) domain-containing protein
MMTEYEVPDELLARCAGQAAICKTVLGKYTEQMNGDIPHLAQVLSQADLDQAARLAHRIKGASANVAAEELRLLAGQLEAATAVGQLETATTLLTDLHSAWGRYEELTANFLSS